MSENAERDPHFECVECQDERVILVPDPKEAPTYESGPYAASAPCPRCSREAS